jgi:hypothetical protein
LFGNSILIIIIKIIIIVVYNKKENGKKKKKREKKGNTTGAPPSSFVLSSSSGSDVYIRGYVKKLKTKNYIRRCKIAPTINCIITLEPIIFILLFVCLSAH